MVLSLIAGALAPASAELLLGAVVRGGEPPQVAGAQRVFVAQGAVPVEAPEAWPIVDLLGPLPDETGADLLAAHPDWLEVSADGAALPRSPCYAIAGARAARGRQVLALADGAPGVCLRAFPREDWPRDPKPDRTYGLNPEMVAAFSERYGRDPKPAATDSVDRALLAGLKAEMVGELLGDIRRQAPSLKLALACDVGDLNSYAGTGVALDVPGYLAEGLLDEVMARSSKPVNLMGLKLATDRDVRVWAWCSGDDATGLSASTAWAFRSPGVDGVVLDTGMDLGQAVSLVRAAEQRQAERLARQRQLQEAGEKGDLITVAGVDLSGELDQATIHGVAQSFTVDRDAHVTAVGIVACLRGPAGAGLPEMPLSIRSDADGKPGEVLSAARLYPEDLSAEPGYRWAYAELEQPLDLKAGQTYWLHGADVAAQGSSYMWRMRKGDAYAGGHAWSSKYDYSKNDWVFSVLSRREQP